jgi:hypothetical protein
MSRLRLNTQASRENSRPKINTCTSGVGSEGRSLIFFGAGGVGSVFNGASSAGGVATFSSIGSGTVAESAAVTVVSATAGEIAPMVSMGSSGTIGSGIETIVVSSSAGFGVVKGVSTGVISTGAASAGGVGTGLAVIFPSILQSNSKGLGFWAIESTEIQQKAAVRIRLARIAGAKVKRRWEG